MDLRVVVGFVLAALGVAVIDRSEDEDPFWQVMGGGAVAFVGCTLIVWFVPCLNPVRWAFVACSALTAVGLVILRGVGPDAHQDNPVRMLGLLLAGGGALGIVGLGMFGSRSGPNCDWFVWFF